MAPLLYLYSAQYIFNILNIKRNRLGACVDRFTWVVFKKCVLTHLLRV